jgi:hypothetical protein
MNWREFGPIHKVLNDYLPDGLELSTIQSERRDGIIARVVNVKARTILFQKEYNDLWNLKSSQIVTLLMTDIRTCIEVYESPLSKALSE